MARGSVAWALADTVRQPLRAADATSGASDRSVAATIPSVRAGPIGPRGGPGPSRRRRSGRDARRSRDRRGRCDRAGSRWPSRAHRRSAGRSSRSAARLGRLADDGHGDGGGAEVDGQRRHGARWSPEHATRRRSTSEAPVPFGQASQVISSSISSSRMISCSMPASSARISVAEATSPPNTPRRTGSKNSIAFAPSARYGRLASRKWTAGPVRPRSWISRATARRVRRAAPRSDRTGGSYGRRQPRAVASRADRPARKASIGGRAAKREDDVLDGRRPGRARRARSRR